jgi:hypothetical protein
VASVEPFHKPVNFYEPLSTCLSTKTFVDACCLGQRSPGDQLVSSHSSIWLPQSSHHLELYHVPNDSLPSRSVTSVEPRPKPVDTYVLLSACPPTITSVDDCGLDNDLWGT